MTRLILAAGILISLFTAGVFAATPPAKQTLFQSGQGAYNNYRIPAALVTPKGTVLAFCEGRQTPFGGGNDTGEINIILRRSTDGGATFSPPSVVWADGKNTCGNPCVVFDSETSTIILLMTHNRGADHEKEITAGTSSESRTVWITSSTDEGATWAAPREITAAVKKPQWAWYATGPGIGIQIQHGPHRGRLVIPCDYVELGGGLDHGNSHIIYSDDHGQSWKIGGEPPEHHFNESQIVELEDGLALNMRSYVGKKGAPVPHSRGISVSKDAGESFAQSTQSPDLIDSVCQASVLRYSFADSGKGRILFSNPPSPDKRMGMLVRMSQDDGKTWPTAKSIFEGWTGYSCLCKFPDGSIGLLHEAGDSRRYERIDFVHFSLDWLTSSSEK